MDPQMFIIPRDMVKVVTIHHPRYRKVDTLNLRWYALPSTANMALRIGGIEYGAAPFSGIHVSSSIAKGPLNEETRYNFSAEVASAMDLDVTKNPENWRDKAVQALEEAIMYSFKTQGVKIYTDANIAEIIEDFVGELERRSSGCALNLESREGEAVQCLIDPGVKDKCRRFKLESGEMTCFQHQDEEEVRKYMWSRFRKGTAPNRVGAIWHRRGRLRAIAWASRFFTRMMGHVARRRFNCAHVLYTRSHGASHRHADILKRMLQNYFEIA